MYPHYFVRERPRQLAMNRSCMVGWKLMETPYQDGWKGKVIHTNMQAWSATKLWLHHLFSPWPWASLLHHAASVAVLGKHHWKQPIYLQGTCSQLLFSLIYSDILLFVLYCFMMFYDVLCFFVYRASQITDTQLAVKIREEELEDAWRCMKMLHAWMANTWDGLRW